MTSQLITLKSAIAIEVPLLGGGKRMELCRYLRSRESMGSDPITFFCTDVGVDGEKGSGPSWWYKDWLGGAEGSVTVTTTKANVLSTQSLS